MRVYDGKNIKYQDKLAEKRRRVYVLKTLFFIGLAIAIVGFILYLLFFSGVLEISQVKVNGLDKVSGEEFNGKLNERLNSKWLGLLEHQKSVIFFDSDAFRAEILSVFPEIKEISVNKEPPHALNINVKERMTAGIWCFTLSEVEGFASSCKYFDEEGTTWGEAAKSSGFLILVVEDMRKGPGEKKGSGTLEEEYLTPSDRLILLDRELLSAMSFILERLKEKDIFISKFIIPDNFIGDFSAFTSGGYELLFSVDSDIRSQLEVLEIFLAEKMGSGPLNEGDLTPFNPQYIDLRINGRVYHK